MTFFFLQRGTNSPSYSSSSCLVYIKWMLSLQVTGYGTNYVEQSVTGGLCSSVKPDFHFFHLSANFRVCQSCRREWAGLWVLGFFLFVFLCEWTFSYVWMHDFSFSLLVCDFVLSISVSIVTISVFSPPSSSFPSPPKHRFPFPASSSRLTQPKPLAFLTFAFFFKNGFSFLLLCFLS